MLIVYYRSGCNSSIKALIWLREHGVRYKKRRLEQLSHHTLLSMLALTENGMVDLFKRKSDFSTQEKIKKIQEMSFNQAIDYLSHHPEVLRTPIFFSHNKLLIGYHDTEIRQFMPRSYRLLCGAQIAKKGDNNG